MNARIDTLHATAPTTPLPLSAEQQIGQIAVQLPGATAVFRRLKLDFCCGGQVSLAKAAADKGLDADAVLAELAALQRSDAVPEAASPSALIDHILARYHEVHRQQLPELIRMARRVEAVHRDNPHVPVGLADHLEAMHEELLSHMLKEEQVLFPMLKNGGNPFVGQPIGMMRAEHVDHGEALDKLNALTNDATPPKAHATPGARSTQALPSWATTSSTTSTWKTTCCFRGSKPALLPRKLVPRQPAAASERAHCRHDRRSQPHTARQPDRPQRGEHHAAGARLLWGCAARPAVGPGV